MTQRSKSLALVVSQSLRYFDSFFLAAHLAFIIADSFFFMAALMGLPTCEERPTKDVRRSKGKDWQP